MNSLFKLKRLRCDHLAQKEKPNCIERYGSLPQPYHLAALEWKRGNPVRNVDNLFPTTKGKNIVCLFKKNVTTWQLGVRVEEKRNGRERKSFFYLIPDTCKPNDDFVHLHHLKNVERACVIWAPFDVSRLLLRKWLLDAVFSTTGYLKTVGTPKNCEIKLIGHRLIKLRTKSMTRFSFMNNLN